MNGPTCRFREPQSNIKFDVMSLSKEVPGFSNRWYEKAIQNVE